MNIYITPQNEMKLREMQKKGESMSGLINRLLDENLQGSVSDTGIKKTSSKAEFQPAPSLGQLSNAPTTLNRKSESVCKTHGLPSLPNGKCLRKDCK